MTLPTFIAWEAVQVASDGGLVVILTKQPREGLTDLLNNGGQDLARTVRRVNGNEGMDFHSGGQIRIIRRTDSGRGYSANLAIIPIGTSHDAMMNILPMLATTGGDVVGYY